jgi:hypothetical protein
MLIGETGLLERWALLRELWMGVVLLEEEAQVFHVAVWNLPLGTGLVCDLIYPLED